MKTFKKMTIIMLMLTMVLPLSMKNVFAEENGPNYAVNTVKHPEQIKYDVGYYLLPLSADLSAQPIEIELINNSSEEQNFKVELLLAKTNANGLLVYEKDAYGPNETLKFNIEDYADAQTKTVSVAANSKKNASFKIDTSQFNDYEGVLMGGFVISQSKQEESAGGIGHVFNYEIPLVLTDDSEGTLYDSKTLDFAGGILELINGYKVISYEIHNNEPNMIARLNIKSELVNKKNEKVALSVEKNDFSIAPNGILPVYLEWGRLNVEPGDYTLKVKANNEKQEWEWEKDITIEREEARQINEESSYKVLIPKSLIYITVLLLFLTITNHVVLLNRKDE